MATVILILHIILAVALIGIILVQRSEGNGLGNLGGGGGGANFMTGRATANLLTKATTILAIGFMCTSVFLAMIASKNSTSNSLIESYQVEEKTAPVETPIVPEVPLAE